MFPELAPFKSFQFKVSNIHTLNVELSGNPKGKPALLLHGGPGSGISETQRRQFDPDKFFLIQFDQRGNGKSTPFAETRENTTWDLVEDIEKIRNELKIDRWLVAGGSWGSTLALVYAETHPSRVTEIIVNGIFLGRKEEVNWFYQSGASFIFPDQWLDFVKPIDPNDRGDLLGAYSKLLRSSDKNEALRAAKAWSKWEGAALKLVPDPKIMTDFEADDAAIARAKLEVHYFENKCFLKTDNWIIENIGTVRKIPGIIIHGRYDIVCPFKNAWDLKAAWPEAKLTIVADAGHARSETGISEALISATSRFL